MKQLLIAIKATLLLTVLTGLLYPLAVTGLAQILFPHQADGSLKVIHGKTVGSELIGQRFISTKYFHGRPSAAGNDGYDGLASGGSNYGPTNQHLSDRVSDDVKKFRAENPAYTGPIPADLLTASASGLDPHISPASAQAQVARVAAARGVSADTVQRLVDAHTEGRQYALFGEPRVNVLELNLALDQLAPAQK